VVGEVRFLRFGCGVDVVVVDEAVGIAAALFGFDDDLFDFAEGFEECSEVGL
jgi:hypothetical protein